MVIVAILPAQPRPADVDHGYLMNHCISNIDRAATVSLAGPSRRASVAITGQNDASTSIRTVRSEPSRAPDRKHYLDGRRPQRPSASSRSGIPAISETPINTHRSDVVQRFSPIHF